MIDLSPL
jgi:hypothetical protein